MRRRVLLATALALGASACATRFPLRTPTQERVPMVTGQALDGRSVTLPKDLAGAPAVLLVAYDQDTQFDVDRWILGLLQLEAKVRIVEVPTIPGMVPGLFSGRIDAGMRRGIPQADWGVVLTLYDDEAAVMAAFTGNAERRRNTRVLGLDAEGVVRFFTDEGYSATGVQALLRTLTSTQAE